ncbi:NepR family anti-sigma factor [Gluconacetobacter sacchari]|uniref:Anti-sigma factor NepR domain-containing protein n=1 Tax=Gluconacetobacter sacchari TaxID=92759 RepID=A0A7W4I9P4_9PROT|nr:hypothetical protein [Gluconacetobacter sacchari]
MNSIVETWIGQSLHDQFDRVVEEPVPEKLLGLLDGLEKDDEDRADPAG